MDKILEGIRAVRDSGFCNMMAKNQVQFWAFHMSFYETVDWITNANGGEYVELLRSTDWDTVDELYDRDLGQQAVTNAGVVPTNWEDK